MSFRLIIALTLSLVLHGALLVASAPGPFAPPRAARMQARLRPPPAPPPQIPEPFPDHVLKNTLEENTPDKSPPLPPVAPERKQHAREIKKKETLGKHERQAVEKKLSEYVFYPEQAIRLGLEGTVVLFVELQDDGRIQDVRIVTSSGHPILDNAAIKGFYAVGKLPGKSDTWSYTFRLQ